MRRPLSIDRRSRDGLERAQLLDVARLLRDLIHLVRLHRLATHNRVFDLLDLPQLLLKLHYVLGITRQTLEGAADTAFLLLLLPWALLLLRLLLLLLIGRGRWRLLHRWHRRGLWLFRAGALLLEASLRALLEGDLVAALLLLFLRLPFGPRAGGHRHHFLWHLVGLAAHDLVLRLQHQHPGVLLLLPDGGVERAQPQCVLGTRVSEAALAAEEPGAQGAAATEAAEAARERACGRGLHLPLRRPRQLPAQASCAGGGTCLAGGACPDRLILSRLAAAPRRQLAFLGIRGPDRFALDGLRNNGGIAAFRTGSCRASAHDAHSGADRCCAVLVFLILLGPGHQGLDQLSGGCHLLLGAPIDHGARHALRQVLVDLDGGPGLLLEGLNGLPRLPDDESDPAVVQRGHLLNLRLVVVVVVVLVALLGLRLAILIGLLRLQFLLRLLLLLRCWGWGLLFLLLGSCGLWRRCGFGCCLGLLLLRKGGIGLLGDGARRRKAETERRRGGGLGCDLRRSLRLSFRRFLRLLVLGCGRCFGGLLLLGFLAGWARIHGGRCSLSLRSCALRPGLLRHRLRRRWRHGRRRGFGAGRRNVGADALEELGEGVGLAVAGAGDFRRRPGCRRSLGLRRRPLGRRGLMRGRRGSGRRRRRRGLRGGLLCLRLGRFLLLLLLRLLGNRLHRRRRSLRSSLGCGLEFGGRRKRIRRHGRGRCRGGLRGRLGGGLRGSLPRRCCRRLHRRLSLSRGSLGRCWWYLRGWLCRWCRWWDWWLCRWVCWHLCGWHLL
mmetsp:Transcript_120134/g.383516  ORF Transcript_120134/g.383516 Transcript_120134/m.383516 type:complete len:777 (+) Transcript_120134:283-2613(+)